MTLNLLHISRINPQLSLYAQLWGSFNYDKTPIVHMGTKLLLHEKPEIRESWAPHTVKGW